MTPNILHQVIGGGYKAEWDSAVELPDVPDYEETMIWDPARRRRDDTDDSFNGPDAMVGDFENPDFWETPEGGSFGGDRTSGGSDDDMSGAPSIARIVGGKVAQPFSYPWMVRVRACSGYACTRMCGGTLVSDRAIVTASHCIPPYAQQGLITLGAHEYYNTRALNVTIQSIHQHPGWNKQTRINDIAVIILGESVAFSNKVQPACLPNKDHCFASGTACIATGWGYIKEGGPRSSLLREVPVRMMDNKHCNSADYYNGRIKDGMLCAGYNEGQRDACTGDSGGPLVCPIDTNMGTRWVLAGVTSWGVGCARFQRPGVYSNVAQFSDWIGSIIRQYPSVVGQCKPTGNGYGYDGDWSWTGQAPSRKPQSKLFFSNGNSFGADGASTAQKPAAAAKPVSWPVPSAAPATQAPKPFFPATAPPPPAPVDPFAMLEQALAESGEKGANKCDGMSGKALKKCKKGSSGKPAKQDKQNKKNAKAAKKQAKKEKKDKKKNKSMAFEGLSKKEAKKLKKQQAEEEEASRSDGVTFDSADSATDDNQMFAGWDYDG